VGQGHQDSSLGFPLKQRYNEQEMRPVSAPNRLDDDAPEPKSTELFPALAMSREAKPFQTRILLHAS
jgi:hypothetical protein